MAVLIRFRTFYSKVPLSCALLKYTNISKAFHLHSVARFKISKVTTMNGSGISPLIILDYSTVAIKNKDKTQDQSKVALGTNGRSGTGGNGTTSSALDDNGNDIRNQPIISGPSSLEHEEAYQDAISALNSLQSNAQVLKLITSRAHHQQQPASAANATHAETLEYLQSTGLTLNQLDSLKLIHVAGTKGKGSTCAFVESILKSFGLKTGFFSSPHLISVRERIRINGEPLSKNDFTKYFFEVYDRMNKRKKHENDMPAYFRFLTCMALYVFYKENVDVGILEVGIGGTHDSTNIIRKPVVVGITSLGLDHQSLLGNTLEEITLQKAGIMKPNVPIFTTSTHPKHILRLLQDHAEETKCPFFVSPELSQYDCPENNLTLGINGNVSHMNAALALQLTNAFLAKCYPDKLKAWTFGSSFSLSKEHIEGLRDCKWDGRFQTLKRSKFLTYYLDGAHTIDSLTTTKEWFWDKIREDPSSSCILIFHVTRDRSIKEHLLPLTNINFDQVIFCPVQANSTENWSAILASTNIDAKCKEQADTWTSLVGNNSNLHIFNSAKCVTEYLDKFTSEQKKNYKVLITGSLHLVGNFLSILSS